MFNIKNVKTFIFDLDGVIWRGHTAIDGAVESVRRLQEADRICLFCTNNSMRTQKDFAASLRSIGITLHDGDVTTSSSATAAYVVGAFRPPCRAFVIGEKGIASALRTAGAQIVTEAESGLIEMVDCVVVGIDRSFTYNKLRLAQRYIMGGASFIATNPDTTFPTEQGLVPGAGSIVAAVEAATGVKPVVIGKPAPTMVQLILEQLGLSPAATAMVGDRLDTDIASAHRAGIGAVLIATGVTPLKDALRAKGELRPHQSYADLPALCEAVLSG